jgi:hypothetical protein
LLQLSFALLLMNFAVCPNGTNAAVGWSFFAFARRVGYVERSNEPEWVTAGLYSTALVLPCKTSIVRVLNGFA